MNDDGHTSECTWQHCAHPESPNPCPFAKPADHEPSLAKECDHDWRQLLGVRQRLPDMVAFYCTKCLDIQSDQIVL